MTISHAMQGKAPFVLRHLRAHFKYCCIINVVCALLITFLVNGGRYFLDNLLASFCIGTIIFLVVDGVRLTVWGDNGRPHWLHNLLLIAIAVPIGQIAGSHLFGWLTGQPAWLLSDLVAPKRVGFLMFSLFAACASSLFFFARERTARQVARLEAAAAEEKARAERIERQALQAQLQLLQAQIEPHMLFNTLANLQGLIGVDAARAQQLLDHLIQYLRATLLSSRAASTTLGQEFALMEAYLGLMAIRMGPRLSYAVQLPAPLAGLALPPMLLQPLVENAIQHGLEAKIDGGHIAVSAARDGATLTLTVADNGLGLHQPRPVRAGTHVGLANIRERLLALHGTQAALTLVDGDAGGAVARLTLPLARQPSS